jgi:hypothetical protein
MLRTTTSSAGRRRPRRRRRIVLQCGQRRSSRDTTSSAERRPVHLGLPAGRVPVSGPLRFIQGEATRTPGVAAGRGHYRVASPVIRGEAASVPGAAAGCDLTIETPLRSSTARPSPVSSDAAVDPEWVTAVER